MAMSGRTKRILALSRATFRGARTLSRTAHRAGRMRGRREGERALSGGRLLAFVSGAGLGVGMAYLLDPAEGKRRRHVLRDMATARLRRGSRSAEKRARDLAGRAQGAVADATPPGRDSSELNDPALEAKVESELFRSKDAPKDSVDVNVENGVVYLRGVVTDHRRIERIVDKAQAIEGVSRAESLLHVPGEPAPSKS